MASSERSGTSLTSMKEIEQDDNAWVECMITDPEERRVLYAALDSFRYARFDM